MNLTTIGIIDEGCRIITRNRVMTNESWYLSVDIIYTDLLNYAPRAIMCSLEKMIELVPEIPINCDIRWIIYFADIMYIWVKPNSLYYTFSKITQIINLTGYCRDTHLSRILANYAEPARKLPVAIHCNICTNKYNMFNSHMCAKCFADTKTYAWNKNKLMIWAYFNIIRAYLYDDIKYIMFALV
jgi:hypothetical protein